MIKRKFIIVIAILSIALMANYALPVAQYKGTNFIQNVKLPSVIGGWVGRDISTQLNLDSNKDWNKFISQYLINEYTNVAGQKITFILLDAGNFHNPKVCFTASGFKITELQNTEMTIANKKIKAYTLFTEDREKSILNLYWIIIDKKIVNSWTEQKIKQFFFSLFNKQRVGLMVRFDVLSTKDDMQKNVALTQDFINNLIQTLPVEQAVYIFGE